MNDKYEDVLDEWSDIDNRERMIIINFLERMKAKGYVLMNPEVGENGRLNDTNAIHKPEEAVAESYDINYRELQIARDTLVREEQLNQSMGRPDQRIEVVE